MLHESPLRQLHQEFVERETARRQTGDAQVNRPGAATGQRIAAEVQYLPYGAPDAAQPACELVASYGEVELEYAAIRRGAGLLDSPHRGTLIVTGEVKQRRDFLNRMLTQELKDLAPGVAKPSFWLNRKGRIDADLLLMELGDRTVIDVDVHQAGSAAESLNAFIVAEDVQVENASSKFHHLAIHGRRANDALRLACDSQNSFQGLQPGQCSTISLGGVETIIARRDQTGEIGYEMLMPFDSAAAVWNALLGMANRKSEIENYFRPIGWHAFNIARIEAGTPLFNIDFGMNNLPHESGILRERVSFTKGCYLGQEVVARMENLGKPKQMLVGLRMKADLLPTAGEQVFAMNPDGSMSDEIGVVTSSTLSPMLGAAPIAFAMIKSAHAAHGTTVLANAEGEQAQAVVGPVVFLPG